MKPGTALLLVLALALTSAPLPAMAEDGEPVDPPPGDEPPADEPPADEPPADEPPADESPADEPPADEPPADEPPADEPGQPLAGWDRGFFISSADGAFRLQPIGRVQLRYTLESSPGDDGRDVGSRFVLQRARLGFKGHLFDKRLTYRVEVGFGQGGFAAKWMFVDYALVPGWLQVRAGHIKRPWSRQNLTGDQMQALVDRSITHGQFGQSYDLGVMVHNGSKQPLEWAVALMNGGGKSRLEGDVAVDPTTGEGEITGGRFTHVVDMFQPTTVLRVGYNHAGIKGQDELDLRGGGFRFAVAGGAMMSFDIAGEQDGWFGAQVDAIVKIAGFSATGALYLSTAQDGATWGEQAADQLGFHVQAAWVVAGKVAPAFRYARLVPLSGADGTVQELGGGVTVLFWGHNVQWATDFVAVGTESLAPADTDFRLRSQVQVHF